MTKNYRPYNLYIHYLNLLKLFGATALLVIILTDSSLGYNYQTMPVISAPALFSQKDISNSPSSVAIAAFFASAFLFSSQVPSSIDRPDDEAKPNTHAAHVVEMPIPTEFESDTNYLLKYSPSPNLLLEELDGEDDSEAIIFLRDENDIPFAALKTYNSQGKIIYLILSFDEPTKELYQTNDPARNRPSKTRLLTENSLKGAKKKQPPSNSGDQSPAENPDSDGQTPAENPDSDGQTPAENLDNKGQPCTTNSDEESSSSQDFNTILSLPMNKLGGLKFEKLKPFLASGTPAAIEWTKTISNALSTDPSSVAMPCMAETMEDMRSKINEWLALDLNEPDKMHLNDFKGDLENCCNNNCEYLKAEQLFFCFNLIHEYIALQYLAVIKPALINEEEKKILMDKWKGFFSSEQVSIKDLCSLDWGNYLRNQQFLDEMIRLSGIDDCSDSLNSRYKKNALKTLSEARILRIYTFKELTVSDVLLNCSQFACYIGLSKTLISYQDGIIMIPSSFTYRDFLYHCFNLKVVNILIASSRSQKNSTEQSAILRELVNGLLLVSFSDHTHLDEPSSTLLLLFLFEIFHEAPYLLYIHPDHANPDGDYRTIISTIKGRLKEGGKYNGGDNCSITRGYRDSLQKEEEMEKLLKGVLSKIRITISGHTDSLGAQKIKGLEPEPEAEPKPD